MERWDEDGLRALLRLVRERCAASAAVVIETGASGWRVVPGLSLPPGAGRSREWQPADPRIAAALAQPGPVRLEAAMFHLTDAPTVQRLIDRSGMGLLLVGAEAPAPVVAAALHDAATVIAGLRRPVPGLEPQAPMRATVRTGPLLRTTLTGAILPQAAAHRQIAAALRAPATDPRALMVLDLDRFRAVNEALGIAAGDALLAVVAARIDAALGSADRLIRLDGDRFALVVQRPRTALAGYAGSLLARVCQPLTLEGQTVSMQACVGIVAPVHPEVPVPVLLTRADTALRRAKGDGRHRVVFYEQRLDTVALERSQLELELANAPGNGQMRMVYQPYVELASGRISGVEALMRWRHPARGTVQPATFIPMAEATGLILPLGRWALRTACRAAVHWPEACALSVNISALQFHQPDFATVVDAVLAETGFAATRLELEITETVLMRDNPETIAQLEALIDRGIRIALDDFGTGYSALAYLARLPHHRIKLDRAFVRDLANPATADLIRAIIAVARTQDIAVTAEGVERPEQVDAVRAMGFTHVQGFATGGPVDDPSGLLAERVSSAVS